MSKTISPRRVKDLSIDEFTLLMKKVISEDISEWQETFEIMADKKLMNQIIRAERARLLDNKSQFVAWNKVKKNV